MTAQNTIDNHNLRTPVTHHLPQTHASDAQRAVTLLRRCKHDCTWTMQSGTESNSAVLAGMHTGAEGALAAKHKACNVNPPITAALVQACACACIPATPAVPQQ